MHRKVKILGIAPYEGLASLMQQYGRKRSDIELTTVIGSMEEGSQLAKQLYMNYDVIISRANTASIISQAVPLTVIDIGIGYYDVLRCIKLAESTKTKFAIVGFQTLTSIAKTICDLLKTPIDIFPISTYEEAVSVLDQMKSNGYSTIVCDTVPYDYAKQIGITPLLLTSSEESLSSAIDQAVYLWNQNYNSYYKLDMMKEIISLCPNYYLILDVNGNCLYSTWHEPLEKEMSRVLHQELKQCCLEKKRSFFVTLKDHLYSVFSHYIDYADTPYIVFRIVHSSIPLSHSKYGISVMDKKMVQKGFNSSFYYGNTEIAKDLIINTAKTNTRTSLMIAGEIGTGKDHMAKVYYMESDLSDNPLYIINCSLLTDKGWKFITNSYNSPFTDNNNTIYISNIDKLSAERQKNLLSIIIDTNVHIRNRLIFSCTQQADGSIPHVAKQYTNTLGCILAALKPIRELKDEIPSLASQYLNRLNQSTGKVVAGFDDSALKLLTNYHYPHNNIQFKRIIKEAVINSDTSYISEESIQNLLDQENSLYDTDERNILSTESNVAENCQFILNINKSLEEINRDIILYTLKNCNGNQSIAAKKLGIGRTTLWRYIKTQDV